MTEEEHAVAGGRGAGCRLGRRRARCWGTVAGALAATAVASCRPVPPRGPGCLEPPPATGAVVARVGDVAVSAARIEARLRAQGPSRPQFETPAALRELVEDEVRFELLAQAAAARGLAADEDVIDAARRVMVRKLLQRDLDRTIFAEKLGDAALQTYYERHRDNYLQPEKRRYAHIQLAATEEGRAQAQALIDRLATRSAGEFAQAAARLSVDSASRGRHGEQPFQTRDEVSEAFGLSFAAAVFAQAPGQIGPSPVPSTRGWHVVRVLARREALARDFGEVREQIRERLLQGQRAREFEDYVAALRQVTPVTVDAAALAAWPAGAGPR